MKFFRFMSLLYDLIIEAEHAKAALDKYHAKLPASHTASDPPSFTEHEGPASSDDEIASQIEAAVKTIVHEVIENPSADAAQTVPAPGSDPEAESDTDSEGENSDDVAMVDKR